MPNPPNPWDIPPPPAKGDDDINTTYRSIGQALSTWEWFEGHLAIVFSYFLGAPDNESFASLRVYGSVLTFRGRCEMIDAAAEAYLTQFPNEAIASLLRSVTNKAGKLSARRNEIAHGMVQNLGGEGEGYVVAPSYYATNKRKLGADAERKKFHTIPTYQYSSVEIDAFDQTFRLLYHECMELLNALYLKRTEPKS